jgi:uncharacterized protein
LRDARILFENESYSSAVNRIYYALFYAVTALLLTRDMSSAKHSGMRSLFNENFVKPGTVRLETGKFFSLMFDFRQKGDYGDFVVFDAETVKGWLERADAFMDEIEKLVDRA